MNELLSVKQKVGVPKNQTRFILYFNYTENSCFLDGAILACLIFHGEETGESGGKPATSDGRQIHCHMLTPGIEPGPQQ